MSRKTQNKPMAIKKKVVLACCANGTKMAPYLREKANLKGNIKNFTFVHFHLEECWNKTIVTKYMSCISWTFKKTFPFGVESVWSK